MVMITVFVYVMSLVLLINANPYARFKSRVGRSYADDDETVYQPILVVEPVLIPVDEGQEIVQESALSSIAKRAEVAYRTLDEYQKKGRPGQPLRFGKRWIVSMLRRPPSIYRD